MYAYLGANLLVQSEVYFLGRFSHPNLIKLLGYCWKDGELLLIYEFMQKGSLENHLFGSKSLKHNWILLLSICAGNVLWMWFKYKSSFGSPYTSFIYAGGSAIQPFPWDIRLKIAIGAARGLAFLHTSDKQVIRRYFKPSNIATVPSPLIIISSFHLVRISNLYAHPFFPLWTHLSQLINHAMELKSLKIPWSQKECLTNKFWTCLTFGFIAVLYCQDIRLWLGEVGSIS